MRLTGNSILLIPALLASCGDTKRVKDECYPIVAGGSWNTVQVGFRYRVTESSDASLVGQVFEDAEEEGPPASYKAPWTIWTREPGGSLGGYFSTPGSAIDQIEELVCTDYYGGDKGIAADGDLLELTCDGNPSGTEGELWLGVSDLNEEGNPCRLFGYIRIFGDGNSHHVIELESTVIYGSDYSGCDRTNGTTTRLWSCPMSP